MVEDLLFNTDTLIVPQYILLALFSWLAINGIQQGKIIAKLLSKVNMHIEQSNQDNKKLIELENKITDVQKEQQSMFKEFFTKMMLK